MQGRDDGWSVLKLLFLVLSYLLIMDIEFVENMFELVENMFDDYTCYLLMGAWLYCMHAG